MEWGSPEWMKARDAKLFEWFGGDVDAVELLKSLSIITELWDDLVDGDKPVTRARVDAAFFHALVRLPTNAFYIKHREYLTPLIIQSINAWQDANALEHGDRNQRALAYTLRNIDIQILQAIVYLTRGYAAMREVSLQTWILFAAEQDDALQWIAGEKA